MIGKASATAVVAPILHIVKPVAGVVPFNDFVSPGRTTGLDRVTAAPV